MLVVGALIFLAVFCCIQVQLSCGEHTDYGMLTMVNQDPHISALQVGGCHLVDRAAASGWAAASIRDVIKI